tara:strand:- start:367 stop:1116 length:750 start_codon:yes stop_codon:yes gene_type:complete
MYINFDTKYKIAKFISNTLGHNFKNNNYKCLLYHSIGYNYDDDKLNIYNISKETFRNQMIKLSELNYEVSNNISDNVLNTNRITITFDDGLLSIYKNALEILEHLNIPYTIFVSPQLIKSNSRMYMNEDQIKSISKSKLCQIGSHGYEHKDFTLYNLQDLAEIQKKSKNYLENLIGQQINILSYPFGKYNSKIDKVMKKIDFQYTFSSKFGSNSYNSTIINRIDIWNNDNTIDFTNKLKGQWDWLKYYK